MKLKSFTQYWKEQHDLQQAEQEVDDKLAKEEQKKYDIRREEPEGETTEIKQKFFDALENYFQKIINDPKNSIQFEEGTEATLANISELSSDVPEIRIIKDFIESLKEGADGVEDLIDVDLQKIKDKVEELDDKTLKGVLSKVLEIGEHTPENENENTK